MMPIFLSNFSVGRKEPFGQLAHSNPIKSSEPSLPERPFYGPVEASFTHLQAIKSMIQHSGPQTTFL